VTTLAHPPGSGHDGRRSAVAYAEAPPARSPVDTNRHRDGDAWARKIVRYLPLVLILVAQAAFTLKLARWAYASGDEGRYIYDGHQLISELWHGGGSPYYETFFSGAPVIYPVLAAMADYVGGLLAVRLMSLTFMLVATCLLFGMSRRWFGYWPALLAAGLFAGIGLTQDLGALGTYDSMSLVLVTAAAYCAARTGDDEPHATRWLLATPLVLLAANATKYASCLFDPVVIGIAVWEIRQSGAWRMAQRTGALVLTTLTVLGVGLLVGGRAYLQGILSSTFSRQADDAAFAGTTTGQANLTSHAIALDSWDWIGAVVALALLALLLAMLSRRGRRYAALLALLLFAGLLVTAEGIHLHSTESMYKHDDFGVWFSAAGAGAVVAWVRPNIMKALIALALIVASGFVYTRSAITTYQASDAPAPIAEYTSLKPYLELTTGRYLLGGLTDNDLIYEDRVSVPWFRLVDDLYIKYPIPGRGGDSHGQTMGLACYSLKPHCMYLEGIAGYRAAIRAHWFALVSMIGEHYTAQDQEIENIVSHTPGYVRLWQTPGPPTWIYAADY
jgi:hypothetical protein